MIRSLQYVVKAVRMGVWCVKYIHEEKKIGWWRSVWCDNKTEVWEEEVEE